MTARQRNGILLYLENEETRTLFADVLCEQGWDVHATSDFERAIQEFGAFGEALAMVICDDMTGPREGRYRGLFGADFFKQRGTHMFAMNIPFVYLMYTGRPWLCRFVSDSGGFVVAMPQTMHRLGELFNQFEREHQLPPKSQPRSGEL